MVLNKTETPLKPIINTSIEMLGPVADQNETEVTFSAPDGLPSCHCDALKIEQVITNFIGNAIEHTPKGTKINVKLEEIMKGGEAFLYFTVTDNGPGVDKDQQDKIFDKYAQLTSRKTAKGLGSGLGLAVSQMTIEQHGGKVGYKDAEPVGSIFYFTIPCKNQDIPKVQPSNNIQAQA